MDLSIDDGHRRALMTETERRNVAAGRDGTQSLPTTLTRVRHRVPELATDVALLREHQPKLYRRLMAAIMSDVAGFAPDDPENPDPEELSELFLHAALERRSDEPNATDSSGPFKATSLRTGNQ